MVSAVRESSSGAETSTPVKIGVDKLSIHYGSETALEGVSFDIREHEIFGIIGPANAGKTSFLKAINRMDLFNSNMRVEGNISFSGHDIRKVRNVYGLRSRIGVVFPLPVGLPLSVYDNVALAPRLAGLKDKAELKVIVERCLTRAALWVWNLLCAFRQKTMGMEPFGALG
jgi:phosphate transport system ATP-binding protein